MDKKIVASKLLKIARTILSYMEIKHKDVRDPKKLLDKCNKQFGTKLKADKLAENWGFNDNTMTLGEPNSVYTSVDKNGKFDGSIHGIDLFGHLDDSKPENLLILDMLVYKAKGGYEKIK